MSDDLERDKLIERLRAEDPAAKAKPEAPGEREAVRSGARELLGSAPEAKRRHHRARLVVAAVVVAAAVAAGLALTLGGSSSGPAQALAIEKTTKWVTLRLTDPAAPDAQMNQELADAGIDRVRVHSVPGAPKSVGTWAGYVELGPHCLGGVTLFGDDVNIPISHPYNRANRHGAEDLFDLQLARRSGAMIAQVAGDPYSKSVVRIPARAVDNRRNAAKILVPVRPRNPDDTAATNDIGVDQLIALGGVFAQYGDAIQSGHTSCTDFGLKPFSEAPFPPSQNGWVVVDVTARRGGARKMTRELRSGGIKGAVRQVPARRTDVGRYMSLTRVPSLPKHFDALGNGSGAYNGADVVSNSNAQGPAQYDIALRRSAFNADPKDRWIIYVGRRPRPGEKPKLIGPDGPLSERAALRDKCDGLMHVIAPKGKTPGSSDRITLSSLARCESLPVLKVPGR
ncbi:MAG: hypothetical protein E6G49_08835 [Actinobacteria bacterium]|nr:MAG: hypothetical protein E6G49_08835 [Actinomycetota bacterium]